MISKLLNENAGENCDMNTFLFVCSLSTLLSLFKENSWKGIFTY